MASAMCSAFPSNIEKTEDAIHQYLYPNGDEVFSPWSFVEGITSRAAAAAILRDIVIQDESRSSNNEHHIAEMNEATIKMLQKSGCDMRDAPVDVWDRLPEEYSNMSSEDRSTCWNQCEREYFDDLAKFVTKLGPEIQEKFGENVTLYNFSYSDNDGSFWSVMEHGGVFHNVPHSYESHH